MSSEEVVQDLLDFVSETGRLPRTDEPGLEELIRAAILSFGSLENALRVAGLLTESPETVHSLRVRRPSSFSTPRARRSTSTYPQDYFLDLLSLRRPRFSNSPTPEGMPNWWERRARIQYICSNCRKRIEKGERYIGRKKLIPGRRGIYGHRGTYHTDHFHIVCLLGEAKAQIERQIHNTESQVNEVSREIARYRDDASTKRNRIDVCHDIIQRAREDYESSHVFWKRLTKRLSSSYVSWSRSREMSFLENEILHIETREIPARQDTVADLKRKISSLEHRRAEFESRMQELTSR